MNKLITYLLAITMLAIPNTSILQADAFTSPIVSIGIGNGNMPENMGPVSGAIYSGEIMVYATVQDTNLDNYHFRVVKDGGIDGYTCTELGGLFSSENQGYASTTLSREVCGYVYNQSVYVSTTGFTNSIIAILNTSDMVAYSGEGDYWLIIGAVDNSGNRSNSNYLNDPKIKITITKDLIDPQIITQTSGSLGVNGPIANSYGVVPLGYSPASVSNVKIFEKVENNFPAQTNTNMITNYNDNTGSTSEYKDYAVEINAEEVSNPNISSENTELLAQVYSSGVSLNWIWLLIVITIGLTIYKLIKNKYSSIK